jgi:phage terminase large subunit GpA-like protein
MISLPDWIADTWAEGIRDRPAQNIWQFAAEHIVFDAKMGNITGPWRPDMTPFTLLFQEAITSNFSNIPDEDWWLRDLVERGQRVDECFVVKSSQTGFTQAMLNACVYLPLFDPGRLLYALDSREKAKRLVKFRLIPFLRRLAGRVIEDDQDVNLSLIELANMILEFGGSYSAGLFAEKPLRYGFLDDVEYMVAEGGQPGMLDGTHVIDHLRSRFTTADDSFIGVVSKPNLETSEFISGHRGGSQHRFFVPCPHCGERQVLELEGLNYQHKGCKDLAGRFDLEAVEALTTYRCAICKHDIEESAKYEMNKAGIMIPKSREHRTRDDDPPLVPRRMSMTINDLNSPFPKVKWGILAGKLIAAENNPAAMRHVLTNHFARPHKIQAIHLKSEQVRALSAGAVDPKTGLRYDTRCAPYRRGEVPFRAAFLSMTIDRQGDRLKWLVFGWKSDGTAALVEYGMFRDRSESAAIKEDYDRRLLDYLDDPVAHHGGRLVCLADPDAPLRIDHGLYDSGHEHTHVYSTCIASDWRIYPSKGAGTLESGRICEGREDFYEGIPILRYHYNDFALKVLFYKYKIERRTEPRLYLPEDIEPEFIVEWLSESLGPKRLSTNTKKMEWQHDPKIGPNDWGDAGKMQYVIWQIVGPGIQAEALKVGTREGNTRLAADGAIDRKRN